MVRPRNNIFPMDDIGDSNADLNSLCYEYDNRQYSVAAVTRRIGSYTGPNSLDSDLQHYWNSNCDTHDRLVDASVWPTASNAVRDLWFRYVVDTLWSSECTPRISHLQSFSRSIRWSVSATITSNNFGCFPEATAQLCHCCLGHGGCLWSYNWTNGWGLYF